MFSKQVIFSLFHLAALPISVVRTNQNLRTVWGVNSIYLFLQEELNAFRARVMEVVRENQQLHLVREAFVLPFIKKTLVKLS